MYVVFSGWPLEAEVNIPCHSAPHWHRLLKNPTLYWRSFLFFSCLFRTQQLNTPVSIQKLGHLKPVTLSNKHSTTLDFLMVFWAIFCILIYLMAFRYYDPTLNQQFSNSLIFQLEISLVVSLSISDLQVSHVWGFCWHHLQDNPPMLFPQGLEHCLAHRRGQ